MIRNLNQFSFKDYGTVAPERTPDQTAHFTELHQDVILDWQEQTVYCAVSEVWVRFKEGMAVLSVSLDGSNYLSFYLDKLVCIRPGVHFYLAPFRQEGASVQLWSDETPEIVGDNRIPVEYVPESSLHVTRVCTFFYHEKERGFFYAGESHPVLELAYVDQGTMHSVADGMDLFLQQGEMVVYAPDQWHMQYADIDEAPRYVTVSFEINGDLQPLYNKKLMLPQPAVTLLQQMLREQERMEPYAGDMIAAQLTQLLLTTLRQQDAPAQRIRASNSLNSENEIIRRAQQYISTHIREKLTVPYVARMVDVSPSYMTALFHKHLQISPGEYIRRIKIQESKQMIREGNMNFTEIAAALHYSTVHHFSRQFKDKFGITPTEYAKSVR